MPNPSTHQLVPLQSIRENVLFMANGSLRSILEISSINFELRSEDEQAGILQNFQRFLNSIDFPLQIVVQSRKFNMAQYFTVVEQATASLTNELLRIQAAEYVKFISELSELANIMSKKFYIVVPFYVSEQNETPSGLLRSFKDIFKSKPKDQANALSDEQFNAYKNQLIQRTELILDGLVALGLKAQILGEDELKTIFTNLYNPDTEKKIN